MSEKSSEYHKKTCIICGCHTNQTINIYEPRSGPNIVRLIQARFKYQPLNEDKYLCYSCNNWLINWHSLQGLNSNEAESSSSTFRSSPVNNMVPEKGSPSETTQIGYTKPIAQIRPQLRTQPKPSDSDFQLPKKSNQFKIRTLKPISSAKRLCFISPRIKTNRPRNRLLCHICGRNSSLIARSYSKLATLQCKSCRALLQWNNMYLRKKLLQRRRHLWKSICFRKRKETKENDVNLVKGKSLHQLSDEYEPQLYQRPLVDGKIVSMLRRLGTTLSRDGTSATNAQYPPIMSPSKRKSQRWTRDIGDNEILLNFNTAITEVLPTNRAKKRLIYHISGNSLDTIELQSSDDESDVVEVQCKINLQQAYDLVPKGLSVSIISNSIPAAPATVPVN